MFQRGVSAGFQARKISWMKTFDMMTSLGHVVIELGFDEPYLYRSDFRECCAEIDL